MDGDGEDRPEEIKDFLEQTKKSKTNGVNGPHSAPPARGSKTRLSTVWNGKLERPEPDRLDLSTSDGQKVGKAVKI